MSIKKAYTSIVSLLEDNADRYVRDVLDQVIELASAKTGGGGRSASNVKYDDNGNVVAIFCYYHKEWEDPSVVEFGKKAGSSTGLSNMCKEGTAQWTKQNNAAKKAGQELLALVSAGEVAPQDIAAHQQEIEDARTAVVPRQDGHALQLD